MNGIKWVDTFPEARDRRDATAYPAGPGGGYLRVYEHPGVSKGLPSWLWVASDGRSNGDFGYRPTAKEAARAAEAAWAALSRPHREISRHRDAQPKSIG
jgi:hypothetical protein